MDIVLRLLKVVLVKLALDTIPRDRIKHTFEHEALLCSNDK
ncbi:MAG: hypothetical protein V8T82_03190 [Romboutsia timonensis]